jgi:sporulation protein YlmC with PRC-barrel domain
MIRTSCHVLWLTVCAAGLARGQVVTTEAPAPVTEQPRRVSQILGSNVQLNNGMGYGTVHDIVIGPENQIQYLVVAHDDQYVALPWTVGRFNPGKRIVMYDVTPTAIQPLLFRRNAWPNFVSPVYTRRVQTIFPGMTRRQIRRMERQSLEPVPPPAGTVVVPPR